MVETDLAVEQYGKFAGNRWIQLAAGFVAMALISNYQYSFTLFTGPLGKTFGWGYPDIAVIFTIFILFETWLTPASGYLYDRFGMRNLIMVGGSMILIAWVGSAAASSLIELYILYGVFGGIGAGIIYIGTVGNALKWFPDRRGLAAGVTAMGFGAGAALTVIPISLTIGAIGYRATFVIFGILQGLIVLALGALILKHPPEKWSPLGWDSSKASDKLNQLRKSIHPKQTIRMWQFWIVYIMFILVASGGLMAVGNLGHIAKTIHISMYVWGINLIAIAITINAIMNGFSRPLWGWVSDRFGRENTMALVFSLEGTLVSIVIYVMFVLGHAELGVLLLPLVFFAWGEIFSLFAAITGDLFGPKYATSNYGMLYTAKGISAIFAGFGAAVIAAYFGSWENVFWLVVGFDFTAALLALFVLKPGAKDLVKRLSME